MLQKNKKGQPHRVIHEIAQNPNSQRTGNLLGKERRMSKVLKIL